ncbi:nitroreductase family protein [Paenibacillus sp. cl141a]|uniref:nitroreductase family protein n=1 Tax=Paenibacillus sp. cl141a TaxID=1761877 RepID=UPI0020C8C46D|nr:nitroreductase family protein [Paenibacillus sp. cl141a]
MNIPQSIRERRTIRRFNTTPVPPELVVSLLNDAVNLYEVKGTPRWRSLFAGTPESRQRLVESMMTKMKENRFVKLMPPKMIDFFIKRVTEIPAHLIFIAESAFPIRYPFNLGCGVVHSHVDGLEDLTVHRHAQRICPVLYRSGVELGISCRELVLRNRKMEVADHRLVRVAAVIRIAKSVVRILPVIHGRLPKVAQVVQYLIRFDHRTVRQHKM